VFSQHVPNSIRLISLAQCCALGTHIGVDVQILGLICLCFKWILHVLVIIWIFWFTMFLGCLGWKVWNQKQEDGEICDWKNSKVLSSHWSFMGLEILFFWIGRTFCTTNYFVTWAYVELCILVGGKFVRHIPKLQTLALTVLSQDSCHLVYEHNWSGIDCVRTHRNQKYWVFSQMKLICVQANWGWWKWLRQVKLWK
jgi:hypothetical protein